jgi:hypothetical protein
MGFDEQDNGSRRPWNLQLTDRQLSACVYVFAIVAGLGTAWLFWLLLT